MKRITLLLMAIAAMLAVGPVRGEAGTVSTETAPVRPIS
jgi:hypothetical protein